MNSKDLAEDGAFFLYLGPLIAAIAYAAYEWYTLDRTSYSMPQLAYLIVSKSQYLFLLSVVLVCLGIIVDVRGANRPERESVVSANSTRLQILGISTLVISFAAALSVVGYFDVATAFANFLNGRYALIFGFLMLGTSIILSPRQLLGRSTRGSFGEVIGLLLMAASPVVLYGLIRVHLPAIAGVAAGTLVFIFGLYLLVAGSKIFSRSKTARTVQTEATT